jgi:hypothetical protein
MLYSLSYLKGSHRCVFSPAPTSTTNLCGALSPPRATELQHEDLVEANARIRLHDFMGRSELRQRSGRSNRRTDSVPRL